ncbi:MAG: polysaccharide biosynthesis C-terminal domain-containing protein [Pseudomonadota bacterium]
MTLKKDYYNSATLTAMGFGGYFLNYGLSAFVARYTSMELYAEISIALKVITILSTIMLLGTNTSSQRFFSTYISTRNISTSYDYIFWNIKVISKTFFMGWFFTLFVLFIMVVFHLWDIKQIATHHLSVYAMLIAPFLAFTVLISSYLFALGSIFLATFLNRIGRYLFFFLCFFTIVTLISPTLETIHVLITWVTTYVILILIGVLTFWTKMPLELKSFFVNSRKFTNRKYEKNWKEVSYGLILNNIIFTIICAVGLFLVAIFHPQKGATALFAVASLISDVLFIISENVYNAVKPRINSLIKSKSGILQLQDLINKTNLIAFSIGILVFIILIIFSKALLGHFGKAYLAAENALVILCLSALTGLASRLASLILAFSGHHKLLIKIAIAELCVLVIISIPLLHFFGIVGESVAILISMLFKAIITVFFVKTYYPIKLFFYS